MQSVQANLRPIPNGLIIDLSGDLTQQSEAYMLGLQTWEQGLGQGKRYLVINFTGVPYINSAGIAILIRLVRAGLKGGYQSFAYGLTPHYQKLFRMVGLTEYLMIYPDEFSILQRIEWLGQGSEG